MAQQEIHNIQEEYHYFNHIAENPKKGKFFISVKDSICTQELPATAGSQILDGYTPRFDATVVERLKDAGGVVIGKTAMDEFGFGSFSINAGLNKSIPKNPHDTNRVCGGSSGGAAGITQKWAEIIPNKKHIALGQSTGGSIACPAAFCGIAGLTPTYGRVSRYGLISYGNSLDKIGPMATTTADCAQALESIAGPDGKDATCITPEEVDEEYKKTNFTTALRKSVNGIKIGVIKEAFGEGVNEEVAGAVTKAIEELKAAGAKIKEVSLPITMKYGIPTYYLIAMTEASTNLAKYCGLRYGEELPPEGKPFNDYFTQIRSANFNTEAKRRIILGTFARMAGFRDAYYIKAAKVRTKIIEEYKDLFKTYDVLISPTMPIIAPTFDEVKDLTPLQHYMMDVLTVGPNLAGLPHISVPCGTAQGMPVGMMIIADQWREKKIIQVADWYEKNKK